MNEQYKADEVGLSYPVTKDFNLSSFLANDNHSILVYLKEKLNLSKNDLKFELVVRADQLDFNQLNIYSAVPIDSQKIRDLWLRDHTLKIEMEVKNE